MSDYTPDVAPDPSTTTTKEAPMSNHITEETPIFYALFREQPPETQNTVNRALTAAANRRFQASQERREAEAIAALAAKLNGAA